MKRDELTSIPKRIQHARLVAGLSPLQMREALKTHGISYSQGGWHRVENTEPTHPNLQLIQTIGKITGISPGWILFGQGEAMMMDASTAIRKYITVIRKLMYWTAKWASDWSQCSDDHLNRIGASRQFSRA